MNPQLPQIFPFVFSLRISVSPLCNSVFLSLIQEKIP